MKSVVTIPAASPETSFRLFLQAELARRYARNAQYSLRAFALHLGVDHSTLSQWLRGRRPITARSVEAIGAALGLAADAIRRHVDHLARDAGGNGPEGLSMIAGETVNLIADWYHFAILELTHLEAFRADSRWIARVLDISVDEVNVALQRLIRLDLLEMAAADRWIDTSGDALVSLDGVAPDTRERIHEQASERSRQALGRVPLTMREHSTITMAVSTRSLPRAIELASRFRQQMIALLQEGEADDVYQFEVRLFPVTTINQEGKDTTWHAR